MGLSPTVYVSSTKTNSSFDPVLAREQLEAIRNIYQSGGMPVLCHTFVMILGKRQGTSGSRLMPFDFSRIQYDLWRSKGQRNIVLKPRQIGSTTYHVLCRLFLPAILSPGTSGLLISQTKPYGAQHFRILQRALNNFGRSPYLLKMKPELDDILVPDLLQKHLLHTQYSARHEILFDFLDSKILVDSAENTDAGTGLTITHLVCTEVAYWKRDPESLLAQAKEAIPKEGTMDIESTPNGMGGYFFEEWQRSYSPGAEFKKHFYPWWYQDEYKTDTQEKKVKILKEEQLSVEEKKLADGENLNLEQMSWRRNKMTSLRAKFAEKYPEDETTCFLTSGDLFFDKEILRWLKLFVTGKEPLETFQNKTLKIYKRRIPGRRYLIGADCAEGKLVSAENADWNAAVVLDIDSGEEMAGYRSKIPPEAFAEDLKAIAEMYNNALVAPERNGPGGSVILTLQRHLLYGNIYMHKEWFKERPREKGMARIIAVAGFPTTPRTRPLALNKLRDMLIGAPEFWHDETFIDECLTFVYTFSNKNMMMGKRVPQAAMGCHDDTVMARAIAAYVRLVVLGYLDPVEVPSEEYGYTGEEEEDMG